MAQPEWIEINSVLAANLDQELIRDALLKLGSKADNFSLCDFCTDHESYETLKDHVTPQLIDSLDSAFVQPVSCRGLTQMRLDMRAKEMTFLSESSVTSQQECEKIIGHRKDQRSPPQLRTVEVRQVDIRWIFADRKNFVNVSLIHYFTQLQFNQHELIMTLTSHFWGGVKAEVLFW